MSTTETAPAPTASWEITPFINPEKEWVQANIKDVYGHSQWLFLSREDAKAIAHDLLEAAEWWPSK